MLKRKAFTLVELLVVVGIIALLVAILLPALAKAREQALRTACGLQLHQFHIALNMYANDNHGWLPIANGLNVVDCDVQEYPWNSGGGKIYTSNFTDLYPRYLNSTRVFRCPAFSGQGDPGYNAWYGWTEHGGPLDPNAYKRSSYYWMPANNIIYYMVFPANQPIYSQGAIRFGQTWNNGTYSTNHTIWMTDVVGDSRAIGGTEGYIFGNFFATPHFNGRNLGGNALYGDGQVEWIPMSSGRWGVPTTGTNGYLFASTDR